MKNWPWKPDPDYRRLIQTLRRKGDPARVPFLELFADPEIIGAVLDEAPAPAKDKIQDRATLNLWVDQRIRFWHCLGYDAFWLGATLSWGRLHSLESGDTAGYPREKRTWVNEQRGRITSWQDFEQYPWPSFKDVDFYPMEYAGRHIPDGMGIIAQIGGVLEPAMWLMGYETFALALYEQPDLVTAIFKRLIEVYAPLAVALVQLDGVIALWMGDDMGYKTGPMISPKHLRAHVFPIQKQIAAIAHAAGLPFLLHSCGNLESVMEDLIEDVGIDAKHSYEDVIEPVEQFCARYGERISVIGGVDMDLLTRGSEEQIRARTRQILTSCAGTGGYILGSGNSLANYIPPENFLAMLDEGWKFNTQSVRRHSTPDHRGK
jgi:uroporphyrinogen decarboxylase